MFGEKYIVCGSTAQYGQFLRVYAHRAGYNISEVDVYIHASLRGGYEQGGQRNITAGVSPDGHLNAGAYRTNTSTVGLSQYGGGNARHSAIVQNRIASVSRLHSVAPPPVTTYPRLSLNGSLFQNTFKVNSEDHKKDGVGII